MTLFRSREDVLLGGVCSGLGRYLGMNPTYVRLFFILLAVGNGIGILIYLLLMADDPVRQSDKPVGPPGPAACWTAHFP